VLYEMLAGTRPFECQGISDTLVSVITKEPDWTALPAETPSAIRRLLRRCLTKDRKRRLADIGDARLDIEEALTAPTDDPNAKNLETAPATNANRALPWTVVAAAVALAGTIFMLWHSPPKEPPRAAVRLSVELGADASLVTDQRWLAYFSYEFARDELYVRPFPGPDGKWQIPTAGGSEAGPARPGHATTWSPTRNELFYTTADNRIMVVPYTADGDVFRAAKPRRWSETRFMPRPRQNHIALHPDGDRFAVATVSEAQANAKQDKLVFIFNFFDELRRIAPVKK
jgi:hypothetical protein